MKEEPTLNRRLSEQGRLMRRSITPYPFPSFIQFRCYTQNSPLVLTKTSLANLQYDGFFDRIEF